MPAPHSEATVRSMTIDLGASYRASRLRISDLVSDALADRAVAATPLWTVHDVIAHLAGVVDDVVNSNLEGVTTDPWTAAQVERGSGKTVTQLLAEWDTAASVIERFLSSPAGETARAAVVDIHTHETDLRTALGLPTELPEQFLSWVGPSMRDSFDVAVVEAGLPAVAVVATDFEMFRGRLGRRTRAEVSTWDWSAEPSPYLGAFFIFGPTEHSIGE
jgi:uncharacterized protein (TIGR03083 family)